VGGLALSAVTRARSRSSILLVALALLGAGCTVHEARAGTQQCNTECQSQMTDCILACDGIRSCEEACKKKGASCVVACTSDASPPPPPLIEAGDDAEPDAGASDVRSVTPKDAGRTRARDR
jgi:hypothetical protein